MDCQVSDLTSIENLLTGIVDDPKISLQQHCLELRVSLDAIRQTVTNLGFKSFIRPQDARADHRGSE